MPIFDGHIVIFRTIRGIIDFVLEVFMKKKTQKKGFSMIEMLIVIAIIAVLVSIIIPTVKTETVRAHAATNAANLRSIEGKLTTMRLQYPAEFSTLLSTASGTYDAIKDAYVFVVDILYGTGAGEAALTEKYEKFTAANNVLTLYAPNVVITDVPSAKRIELRGSDLSNSVVVAEGTQMTVFITKDKVAAAYGYYTKDVFADIAEDGKFDGKIEGGNTGGGAAEKYWCSWAGHNFGADGICKICGYDKRWHTCKDEMKQSLTGLVAGQDGNCDECGAAVAHTCDTKGMFGTCSICGTLPHDCLDNDGDHLCDGGAILGVVNEHGIRLTECDELTVKDDGHYCSYCGVKKSDHNYVGGSCTQCGRSSHVTPNDCTDVAPKDHNCDVCGTAMTGTAASCDASGYSPNGANGHKCKYCGASYSHATLTQSSGWTGTKHSCSTCNWSASCSDNASDGDHLCDTCKNTYGSCESYEAVDDSQHKCTDCNTKSSHNWNSSTDKCRQCGMTDPDDDSSGGGGCVTPDTLVTLADGSKKRIDAVNYSDYLLVWDFYKGDYAAVPAAIIFDHGYDYNTVIALNFSDGTTVKVVNMHQFYDTTLNNLVTINADNVAQFVGHSFAKQGNKNVKLVSFSVAEEYVEAFGIISAVHYNIFVEGMLSADFMPADYDLFTYFNYGSDMKFDQAQMQADIEQYGLYTYEEFADYLTYEQFIGFNVPYMKVAVGKGNYTYEGILNLISEYLGQ